MFYRIKYYIYVYILLEYFYERDVYKFYIIIEEVYYYRIYYY